MIKVGIFFGGASREREVSFAGGRTVYDNLDKTLFEPVPYFVDALGNFVELDWQYIYRGTIRDFFPPAKFLPTSDYTFQLYSESLHLEEAEYNQMLNSIGIKRSIEEIAKTIDFAFLALHGSFGEDGTLQGMLEWYGVPFSGSGILASALGVSKYVQKKWWGSLPLNKWSSIRLAEWKTADKANLFADLEQLLGLPFVAKSSNQGSSIGVQIIKDKASFEQQVFETFFIKTLKKADWEKRDKIKYIQEITDLRIGLGLPLLLNDSIVHHPDELLQQLNLLLKTEEEVSLQATNGEYEVLFEQFLVGREFSCIVVVDDNGQPLALPPTEVVKGTEIFDYNSKYLPGLSHKQTPINIADEKVHEIRKACVDLFKHFEFEVYARIDGFITEKGIFLNDPNTTSGMMPSSFFFHQAAEIGLNPKNFITFIIRNSIAERLRRKPGKVNWAALLSNLDSEIQHKNKVAAKKTKVAVLLGGYSTERHISLESGRNIYEKLGSSADYIATPIFLTGNDSNHLLYEVPINILLKDNADDIKEKIDHLTTPEALADIRKEALHLTQKYTGGQYRFEPRKLTYDDIASEFDVVFIALHGRPGEDGQVQAELDKRGVAYNGSGVYSSQLTINKFESNRILRENGILVADSMMVNKADWIANNPHVITEIEAFNYPLICKPHDEGCSSAVIKINNREMLEAYANLCFEQQDRTEAVEQLLGIGRKDEFPNKDFFMVESFTNKEGADGFLEITGGMLTKLTPTGLAYEVFEPSEALSVGTVLTLAEKFLAGEGQNITPARFSRDATIQKEVSEAVKATLGKVASILQVEGYCRIDAFVRLYKDKAPEVVIIEVNSLPGMTPATCIYHQAAINSYKPYQFIDRILQYGIKRKQQIST
jgi:UDP-N-acetylmuramate--alanine ligase